MPARLLLIVLAYLGFISLGLPDGLLGVAWPSMRHSFGLPLDALGVLLAVTTAGYLLTSAASGRIVTALGVGTLLALSTAATALALLGYGLTPAWWLLVALGFLAGCGAGAIDAGLNSYMALHFSARTLNWLHASFGIGITLGPLIMTSVLSASLAWRWGYLLVGSTQLLLALTFALTRNRWHPTHNPSTPNPTARARDTLRTPAAWLGIALFFVYAGVELGTGQWAYTLLTLSRNAPQTTAGIMVSLYWAGLMIGRILFGIIANRAPLTRMLRLVMLTALLALLLVWLDLGLIATSAALILLGLSLAPIFPSLIAATPARLGASHASSAIGLQIAGAGLGNAILPGLIGVLARAAGLETISASLFVLAVALLALFQGMTAAQNRKVEAGAD